MNGHRSDYYRKLPNTPVAEHFNAIGHTFEDLTVRVIEQIVADSARRKQPKSIWIHTLQTLASDGLNLDPLVSLTDIKSGFPKGHLDFIGSGYYNFRREEEVRVSYFFV